MDDNLRSNLERLKSTGRDNGSSLSSLTSILNIKPKPKNKTESVDALYRFYTAPGAASDLYKQLTDYEKDLLTCVVQSKYQPTKDDLMAVVKKHKFTPEKRGSYRYGFRDEHVTKNSIYHAFFVNGSIPQNFRLYLEEIIPPYQRKFVSIDIGDIDQYEYIIGRDERLGDFDMLLSFINSNSPAATKAGGYINKSSLLKFNKLAGYSDFCNNTSGMIDDIKNAGQAIVSTGMIQLMRAADIIDIVKGKFVPSSGAADFASCTMSQKAEVLYDAYIEHDNSIIDECMRISSAKLRLSKSVYDLSKPRAEIVSYLKECPVNEWVAFGLFTNEIRKANSQLFDVVGTVLIRDDYYNQYYEGASWKAFQCSTISVILLEYLAVLGAVDVLIEEMCHSGYDPGYSGWEVTHFRVTDLGAYLFGITDSYEEKRTSGLAEDELGFIVQPNFDIIIQNGKDRMRHELFFDRFAEKISADENALIYKLDFKSMVRGQNIGMKVKDISEYCEKFSSVPLPENVKTALNEWDAQSSRIRIRTVPVIETDDPYLLEELKSYRGMGALLDDTAMPSVLVLASGGEKKAKSLIEKNNRFCILGI